MLLVSTLRLETITSSLVKSGEANEVDRSVQMVDLPSAPVICLPYSSPRLQNPPAPRCPQSETIGNKKDNNYRCSKST